MIYAKFNSTVTNVITNSVTQWDYGRTLRIDGLNLPTAIRIDFCISGEQITIARIGTTKDNVTDVVIPDSLLEQSQNIVAYVYLNDTTTGKTVRTINIPVVARPKPEEHDTPESKELFAEAIELINDVDASVKKSESTAKTHADSAKESLESTIKAKDEAVKAIQNESATQIENVKATAKDIVAERNQIHLNNVLKAPVITGSAEGESILITDSAEMPFVSMKVFGKSIQDGTPTLEAPVEIVSVENPTISVSDGIEDIQTMNVPHILNGIPVTSGGNYTDADGQQWICDEVDFERGVYINRICTYELTGEESWNLSTVQSGIKEGFTRYDGIAISPTATKSESLWSHFEYIGVDLRFGYAAWVKESTTSDKIGLRLVTEHESIDELKAFLLDNRKASTPVTVKYILETPIETSLSEAEIESFKSLVTNYPTTTMWNDSGANLDVLYGIDTKTYIDRKFAELQK